MPQQTDQCEELSSEVKMLCSLLARIIYRCLRERDPRLLALLQEPTHDPPAGEGMASTSEEMPDPLA